MLGVAKLARGEGNIGLLEVPEPAVPPGYVLIEVKVAGVCGTDIHILHDEYPTEPPVILGHELAGIVAQAGDGVTTCQPGDRVTCETYFSVCGSCAFCRDGFPNLCPSRKSIGSAVNGAFARYVLVPQINVHRLPPEVDEFAGALTEPLACCVHALERTRVEPAQLAVVSGPGAIGLLAAQVVKAAGATVVVLGTAADEERLALARTLGADYAVNVGATDPLETVAGLTNGLGADVVFECSGAAASAQSLLRLLRRHGRYAQVGLQGKRVFWDLDQVCYKELSVSGSFATVPSAWRKALALLGSGQVQTRPLISHVFPLREWERAFEVCERKEGLKVVLTPP